jgi:hypothetical protein
MLRNTNAAPTRRNTFSFKLLGLSMVSMPIEISQHLNDPSLDRQLQSSFP